MEAPFESRYVAIAEFLEGNSGKRPISSAVTERKNPSVEVAKHPVGTEVGTVGVGPPLKNTARYGNGPFNRSSPFHLFRMPHVEEQNPARFQLLD